MGKPHFDTATEIPSLAGKVILITGGTSGLGKECVLSLAAHEPAHIYFTGRNEASAEQVIKQATFKHPNTPITFIKCDLASLDSVKAAAKDFLSREQRLDILMANAGIMALPPGLTKDGYELQFGTNHMGHAALVKLLTPLLQSTAEQQGEARIVWNTSLGHRAHPGCGIVFDKLKTSQASISPVGGPWVRYGQSKLANLLYARSFAKHNPSITSVSIHPGVSATNLVGGLGMGQKAFIYATAWHMMIPAEACAWNQQWAATGPLGKGKRQVESGVFYEPIGVKGVMHRSAPDDKLAEKLWEWTQKELEGVSV